MLDHTSARLSWLRLWEARTARASRAAEAGSPLPTARGLTAEVMISFVALASQSSGRNSSDFSQVKTSPKSKRGRRAGEFSAGSGKLEYLDFQLLTAGRLTPASSAMSLRASWPWRWVVMI